MTLAWFAVLGAVMSWPVADREAARIGRLRAQDRLASAHSGKRFRSLARPVGVGSGSSARLALLALPPLVAALVAAAAVALLLGPAVGRLAAVQLGIAAGVVIFVGLSMSRQLTVTRRRSARRVMVARAVAQLVRELEAGAPADDALASIGEVGREVGRDAAGSTRLADDDPLARVALAWPISERTGVPLMALLTQVRADLAARDETDREVRAVVAGAQASAVLLAGLPVLGLLLGAALGGAPLAVLFASRPGRVLLDLGLIFDAAGVLWTLRIVAGAQRVSR